MAQTNMVDELISSLASLKLPIDRQGSMSTDKAYPTTFITFWNNSTETHSYYDNSKYGTTWNFDINVYSSDPEAVYTTLESVIENLEKDGWIISGEGHDVVSDEATHTGRGINALYLKFKKGA